MRQNLIRHLRLLLRAEFDEDCSRLLEVSRTPEGLGLLGLWYESEKFAPTPLDRVDLLAKKLEKP